MRCVTLVPVEVEIFHRSVLAAQTHAAGAAERTKKRQQVTRVSGFGASGRKYSSGDGFWREK